MVMEDAENNKESVRIQNEMNSGEKSKLDLYSDLIVGRRGFFAFLKYEFIILFCSRTPGALGLVLRRWLYPKLLKKCGRNVLFGANVVLRHPNKIEIGDNVIIDDNCLLDAKGKDNDGIKIGSGVFVGRNSILSCKNGDIILGENVNVGFNSEIFSGSKVTIGANTLIAAYCYFIGGDHDADCAKTTVTEQGSSSYGITVEEGAWFGAGVKVLDGVTIGGHSIIGAGAVVTKNVPAKSVAVGIPAKVIKQRDQADREAAQ
jgi:acetyltransferase-like isoleucine patch superfamily enzyme